MLATRGGRRDEEPSSFNGSGVETGGVATLDLAHLAQQCFGDKDLEIELLQLFRTQSRTLATQLAKDATLSSEAQADLAHRLRGSALAVGARGVARAAEVVEACGRTDARGGPVGATQALEMAQAISKLIEAVSQATAEIDRL